MRGCGVQGLFEAPFQLAEVPLVERLLLLGLGVSSLVRISEVNWFHLKGSPKFPGSFTGFHVTASWPAIKKKRSEKAFQTLGVAESCQFRWAHPRSPET